MDRETWHARLQGQVKMLVDVYVRLEPDVATVQLALHRLSSSLWLVRTVGRKCTVSYSLVSPLSTRASLQRRFCKEDFIADTATSGLIAIALLMENRALAGLR
jgi:hypothetical protein